LSFLLPLALLLGLGAILPLVAHALRRGKAPPLTFPAARFVPARASNAKQRHRVEDKLLLACRMLILLCIALLAATPFAKCSRLTLARTNGASLSAALIIDDSASMRARLQSDRTKLETAVLAGRELLKTAQPGDSFSIVLAGSPARIHLPPTSELTSVREALDAIHPTDRETDLSGALSLARSMQSEAVQKERPLLLLSDLSIPEENQLDMNGVVLPKDELRTPFKNCALTSATFGSDSVQVDVACTDAESLEGRTVALEDAEGKVIGPKVPAKDGSVRVPWAKDKPPVAVESLRARLSPAEDSTLDQIAEDDECIVLRTASTLSILLRADQEKAGLKTGTGTVLQAGVEALERGIRVEPLSLLPDQIEDLNPYSALIVDDPSGFTPEVRDALSEWVKAGGVALLLLGGDIDNTPLGSSFSPFLSHTPSWSRHDVSGANEAGSLGPLSATWGDLGSRFRAELKEESGAEIKSRWTDGAPLVVEKLLGRGLLLTSTLPASLEVSDLTLRPAFLELLDYVVSQAAIRRGASATPVGTSWAIPEEATVSSPGGELLAKRADPNSERYLVEPDVAGRYTISDGKSESTRAATRHVREHIRPPQQKSSSTASATQQSTLADVGISREIALLALIFGVLELLIRFRRRNRGAAALQAAIG